MKLQKKYLRMLTFFLAFLLCIFLPVALAACDKTTDPASDSTGDETPETPKTNTEKFIDALGAYETYFSDISDSFGTELPSVSDHGNATVEISVPAFSIFGESQTDLFDPDQPLLRVSLVRAGDLVSSVITTMMYGEQMRIGTYESATEGYLVFPDLPDQAPIRLPDLPYQAPFRLMWDAASDVAGAEDAFKKLLDSLEGADTGSAVAPDSYLTVAEDGDACTYSLRLTAKQVTDLLADIGLDTSFVATHTDSITDGNYMLLDLTTVGGLPTEMHVALYDMGEAEATAECSLKTSVTGSNTKIDATIAFDGETFLTANATVTSTQGSIVVNATLDMGDAQLTSNVKLLSETETSVALDGTTELRFTTEGDAAFTLPLNVTGKISTEDSGCDAEVELSSSASGMFDISMRFAFSFTPGETSVTMPEGAVGYDEVDLDALREALQDAYPQTLEGFLGGTEDYIYQSYESEDGSVSVAVYEDDFIYLYTYALEYVDDGKSLTFSYNGKSLGSYAYTAIDDQAVECCGMPMYVTDYEDGGRNLYFESEDDEFLWFEIELFLEGSAEINFLMPYETADGAAKILLPDGTALPFDVILPEDETSPLQIGSLTLPRYVDSDLV